MFSPFYFSLRLVCPVFLPRGAFSLHPFVVLTLSLSRHPLVLSFFLVLPLSSPFLPFVSSSSLSLYPTLSFFVSFILSFPIYLVMSHDLLPPLSFFFPLVLHRYASFSAFPPAQPLSRHPLSFSFNFFLSLIPSFFPYHVTPSSVWIQFIIQCFTAAN